MQTTMCSRCGKNVAVIFITKIEAGQTKNEGLCLKCARELHIKPVDDIINKMGISDEDLDNLSGEMMNALSGAEDLMNVEPGDGGEEDDDGKTATFPFLNRLFGGPMGQGSNPQNEQRPRNDDPRQGQKSAKRKFLDNYCIDLTERARQGKLDAMVGREEELERVIQILNRRQKNN
ncbi:MAG: ATP-dependent Clp protease ATP-binding subunit, partial [Oscillospiraceae bacterium]|nr:ATP-dependent Clp protease ATP-binding subunit [Oscillospiraceae bacterium]